MKPIQLVKPSYSLSVPKSVLKNLYDLELGEADAYAEDKELFNSFFDHLNQCGYQSRKHPYSSSNCLQWIACNGSIGWHEDHGLGIVACWIVNLHKNSSYNSHLITKHGGMDVFEGDLFVFNANAGHAWVSNGTAVFLQATVSRARVKK